VVSSALVLMEQIIASATPQRVEHLRRPGQRRRQLAPRQRRCRELLADKILPLCRYFAYVQVAEEEQNLWDEYSPLARAALRDAQGVEAQIYPVFRDLFKKEGRPHDAQANRPMARRLSSPTAGAPNGRVRAADCRLRALPAAARPATGPSS
jgi:uncharacterized sporulation protein YeaH/YhbH (DUF444 family)